MKLGFFTMPVHPKGRGYVETLREDREAFILADRLGFSEAFCGEHLTDEVENISSSMLFIAALHGVTSRIKLGTGVVNLPHSHPVIVAAQAAMLDNLLEGRFLLGIGSGIARSDAEALGILDKNRNALFNEAVEHILAIWSKAAPYDLKGEYWTISTAKTLWPEMGLGSIVKPYQKPHPPILIAASDPDSQGLLNAGRRGWWPMSSNFTHATWLPRHWTNYSGSAGSAGTTVDRSNWRVARSIFVATDEATAIRYARTDPGSPYRFYMSQLLTKLRRGGRLQVFKSRHDMPDEAVTVDYVLDNLVIAGGVDSVVNQIVTLHETTGGFGTLLYCGKDWADPALARRSMELMAEKVMPAVNAAIGHAGHQRREAERGGSPQLTQPLDESN